MSPTMFWLAVVQALTVLVAIGRAKGLALLLGPGGFGVSSTLDQIVVTLFTIGSLGVPFTALRVMSRAHSEGPEAFSLVGGRFLSTVLALAIGTMLVASLGLTARPGLFGQDLRAYEIEQRLAVVGVLSVLLTVFLAHAFAAAGRPALAAIGNLAINLVLAIAAVSGAMVAGLRGLYVATAVVGAGASLVMIGVLARSLGVRVMSARRQAPPAAASDASTAGLVGQSACFYAILVASSLVMLFARTRVLAQLGEVATGQLQAMLSITLTVGAVLYPLSNLYLAPMVNRRASSGSKVTTSDTFVSRMVVLLAIGAVPVALFPAALVRLLYSAAFSPAVGVLWLFVLWQCVYQVAYVYQQLLVGLDDVLYTASAAALAFASAAILLSRAVASFGLAGAALALGSGMLLYLLLLLGRLWLRHGAAPSPRVFGRVAVVLGLVVAAGLAGQGSAVVPKLGVLVLVMLWVRFGLDPEERDPRAWVRTISTSAGLPIDGDPPAQAPALPL